MQLHLIRHGQTDWNATRRVQGQSESVLTPLGRQQATELGAQLIEYDINRVYCSSSVRTRETAGQLFKESIPEIHYLDSLREIHLGPWEGRLYDEIAVESPDDFHHFWNEPHHFQVAGAETFFDLQERGLNAVKEICQQSADDNIAIVSHGAIIKSILCHYGDRPLSRLWEPPQMHNCAHSILELDSRAEGKIIRYAGVEMTA